MELAAFKNPEVLDIRFAATADGADRREIQRQLVEVRGLQRQRHRTLGGESSGGQDFDGGKIAALAAISHLSLSASRLKHSDARTDNLNFDQLELTLEQLDYQLELIDSAGHLVDEMEATIRHLVDNFYDFTPEQLAQFTQVIENTYRLDLVNDGRIAMSHADIEALVTETLTLMETMAEQDILPPSLMEAVLPVMTKTAETFPKLTEALTLALQDFAERVDQSLKSIVTATLQTIVFQNSGQSKIDYGLESGEKSPELVTDSKTIGFEGFIPPAPAANSNRTSSVSTPKAEQKTQATPSKPVPSTASKQQSAKPTAPAPQNNAKTAVKATVKPAVKPAVTVSPAVTFEKIAPERGQPPKPRLVVSNPAPAPAQPEPAPPPSQPEPVNPPTNFVPENDPNPKPPAPPRVDPTHPEVKPEPSDPDHPDPTVQPEEDFVKPAKDDPREKPDRPEGNPEKIEAKDPPKENPEPPSPREKPNEPHVKLDVDLDDIDFGEPEEDEKDPCKVCPKKIPCKEDQKRAASGVDDNELPPTYQPAPGSLLYSKP